MNHIELFAQHKIRIIEEHGEKWIPAIDIARAIGYEDEYKAVDKILSRNRARFSNYSYTPSLTVAGQKRKTTVLNQKGVVAFCMLSKHQNALAFQRWADNVLAIVIDTGKYEQPQTLEERSLALLTDLTNKVAEQKKSIERMEPKEIYYDKIIAQPERAYSITTVAKLLNTGRNKLFKLLRDNKILMSNNEPYQNQIEIGRFIIKDKFVNDNLTVSVTLATQKGLDYIQSEIV